MFRLTLLSAAAALATSAAFAQTPAPAQPMADQTMPAQQPMADQSMAQPLSSGGTTMASVPTGTPPADQRGFAPQAPAGATEEQVRQGDGQLETMTSEVSGVRVTVVASTPVPNPPAGTTSRSPGRGGGR